MGDHTELHWRSVVRDTIDGHLAESRSRLARNKLLYVRYAICDMRYDAHLRNGNKVDVQYLPVVFSPNVRVEVR